MILSFRGNQKLLNLGGRVTYLTENCACRNNYSQMILAATVMVFLVVWLNSTQAKQTDTIELKQRFNQ